MKLRISAILLAVVALTFSLRDMAQTTQPFLPLPTTDPVITTPQYKLSPPDGTVISNVSASCTPWGSVQVGVGANNSKNMTVSNCRLEGFIFPLMFTGSNPGLHIHHCVILNSTPDPAHQSGTDVGDSSGCYIEGNNGGEIDHNVFWNCGWWKGYDVNDPVQRTLSSRHHSIYGNQAAGATTKVKIHHNVILNCPGSQVGWRIGGTVYSNVLMPGFDRDIILGGDGQPGQEQWGEVFGNALFGPWYDAVPYYGGGINLLCPGVLGTATNMMSNSASITNNWAAVDAGGNVIIQIGYWSRGGASTLRPQKVPRLADYYGREDFSALIKTDDADKILAWLSNQLVQQGGQPQTLIGTGVTTDGTHFDMVKH